MKGQKGGKSTTVFPDDHGLVMLGHELGNVLNGLLGMAELLGDSALSAEQQRWLMAIRHSGRQMQSLIQSNCFYQTDGGLSIVPRMAPLDGVELLEQVVTSHSPAAHAKRNRLVLIIDPGLQRQWYGDTCLIRQLLDNLVGNAVKFTDGGDIIIRAWTGSIADGNAATLKIEVLDNGQGLDNTIGETMFGAYQRGHHGLPGATGNRGLGLFICHEIISAMQGRISFSSPQTGGACFRLALPGAIRGREKYAPALNSLVMQQIHCQLELTGPVRRSVGNFLQRLGMPDSRKTAIVSDHPLSLVISEAGGAESEHTPGLVIAPLPLDGAALRGRVLNSPVLESSLGVLLLEFALEARSLQLRNENRGSNPVLR